ncbi:MAG: hypothetical protein HC895_26985, partial [Leptolyngbyaceae cyanobacterium SM1_3_5]|nr:hypothetical protein [Leptolyngbyaceae cyanobacterium SM1_3_5]
MQTPPFALVMRRTATVLSVIVLTLTLVAAVTGVLLAFYYEPAAGRSYTSLQEIANTVQNGELILGLHNYAAVEDLGRWEVTRDRADVGAFR